MRAWSPLPQKALLRLNVNFTPLRAGSSAKSKRSGKRNFDAVIFDIDNVLVDTRASYTDTIRKTVQIYLGSRKPVLTRRDIEEFKSLGGYNDDWDTCYGLLKKFGKKEISMRKIVSIFQPLYLKHFVRYEKLLIPKMFLKKLRVAGLKLGIVTGRNRKEARMALRRFKIEKLFHAMVTVDETPKQFKKPHPYGLLKLSQKLGKNMRYLYVGDLMDDILAAKRAKNKMRIRSCGFFAAASSPEKMKRDLKKAGADFLCSSTNELKSIILS